MNKQILQTGLGMACLWLSACSTMHFINGPQMEDTVVREQWHHLAINGIFEISPPMNLTYNCGKQQWDTVTVERTFLNGLASLSSQYLTVYSPWAIVYECRDPID